MAAGIMDNRFRRPAGACGLAHERLRVRLCRVAWRLLPPAIHEAELGADIVGDEVEGKLCVCTTAGIVVLFGSRNGPGASLPQPATVRRTVPA
jgi:hypothetical protein